MLLCLHNLLFLLVVASLTFSGRGEEGNVTENLQLFVLFDGSFYRLWN